MAESQEPRPPRPPMPPPGTPLPRLWKVEPDPPPTTARRKKGKDGADAGDGKGKSGKKGKKGKGDDAGKEKPENTVLLEETPELDTYETRQKIRIVVGMASIGLFCLIGFVLYHVLSPVPIEEPKPSGEGVVSGGMDRERAEIEAKSLLERARGVARHGNTDLAFSLLTRLKTAYPGTRAAREAAEALEHPKRNLPLFLEGPAVVASHTEPSTPKKPPVAPNVVVATEPEMPKTTTADVNLVLPANPAEPGPPSRTVIVPSNASPGQATKPLPSGFRARPGTRVHVSGWPIEIVGERDGAPMVLVPGGPFTMGRDDGEAAEGPAHPVTLATFYIDKHEVTNRQYDLFLKESNRKDTERQRVLSREESIPCASEDCPVVMVNAPDARDYAKWAGKLLPTEAQWEMAARGADGRFHPWGANPPVWDKKREPRQLDPVMSFPNDVSPFGVYDMAGNVVEWTKDWYDPRYYAHFRRQAAVDPTGPTRPRSSQLTVKGGSKSWLVTKREGIKLDSRLPFLGFRCVLQADIPQGAQTAEPNGSPAAGGSQNSVPF